MDTIITAKSARENNLSKYFTGKPCKNGHISERTTSHRRCIECTRKPKVPYKLPETKICSSCKQDLPISSFNFHKSGEKRGRPLYKCKPCAAEYAMTWAKNNPNKARVINERAYRNNIEKRLSDENRAKRNEWTKIWARNNPGKVGSQSSKRRAFKLRAKPSWADDRYIELFYFLAKEDERSTGIKYNVDHIVPLVSPYVCGLHTEDNLQVLTFKKNNSKGNLYWIDMFDITPELKQLVKDFNGIN